SVGIAEAEQVATTHDGDPAFPRVPVDRDGHRWPLAPTQCLDHLGRNLQAPHGLGGLDMRSELHCLLLRSRIGSWRVGSWPPRVARRPEHGTLARCGLQLAVATFQR